MRETEVDQLGEQLFGGLAASDQALWESRAARREVGLSSEEAAILAFLQGCQFSEASRRNALWLLPIQGDVAFLRHWRLVRTRSRNLKIARDQSAV